MLHTLNIILMVIAILFLWLFYGRLLITEIRKEKQRRAKRIQDAMEEKWPTNLGEFLFYAVPGAVILSLGLFICLFPGRLFGESATLVEGIVAIIGLISVGTILLLRGALSSISYPMP